MSAYVALGNHMWFSQPSTRRLLHVRFLVYRLQDYEHPYGKDIVKQLATSEFLTIEPIRSWVADRAATTPFAGDHERYFHHAGVIGSQAHQGRNRVTATLSNWARFHSDPIPNIPCVWLLSRASPSVFPSRLAVISGPANRSSR